MARLLPEPLDIFAKPETHKMFGSKTTGSSTFYTDLEETENEETILREFQKNQSSQDSQTASEDGNSQDSDSAVCIEEHSQEQHYSHSFHRISNFGGFPRFQPFVMSTSTPGDCTTVERIEETTSIVQMSHSVLEYRNSR